MTLLTSLLTNPTALTIADLVAKAALIVGIAAAVTQLLRWRRASAATQHVVWAASVVALIALPVLTVAAPAWIVKVGQSPAPAVAAPSGFPGTLPVTLENIGAIEEAGTIVPAAQESATALPSLSFAQLLAAVYLLGVLGLLFRLAVGSWSVERLARNTIPVDDPTWLALLRDLSWTMGIDRPVRLLRSDDATIPMTWGTRRPHILLPTEANTWSVERRRAVLTHELAHVVRFDCLTQWLASFACAFYWMHPAAWYAARRLRVERERACDDYVIESGMQPREYASELFEVAQKYRGSGITAAAALGMARPSELEGRMLSLMDAFRSHHAASRHWIAAVAVGMAATLIPLGCVQPGIAQAKEIAAARPEHESLVIDDEVDADSMAEYGDSTFTRSVAAEHGGTLVLDLTTGGTITISGHEGNTIDVKTTLRGRNWRDTEVTVSRSGSTVRVQSRPTTTRQNFSTSHAFEIMVPREQSVQVRSAGGTIIIGNVEGTFTGNTGGGEIFLSNLRGSANLATGGGAIRVTDSHLEGSVRTGGGPVQFRNVSGGLRGDGNTGKFGWEPGLNIESDGSGVLVSHTAGGNIDIPSAPGGADVRTGGGTIRVGPSRGFVHARTGGGAITIESINGRAHAVTGAGAVNIRMVGDPRRGNRDIEVHSGTGQVTLWLPDGLEAEFDIETAYTNNFGKRVRIISDFPLQFTESANWEADRGTPRKFLRGKGRTGAATHKIRVRTVNGDVLIVRGGGPRISMSTFSRSAGGQPGDMNCVGDCSVTVHAGTDEESRSGLTGSCVASSDSSSLRSNMTYFSFQVDQQAEFIFDSTVAVAPSSTRSGGVAVQFVVDQRGQPELGSFKILRSPDDAAAERARNAFPRWRFTPALRDGCPVRQLVQVEVVVAARYEGVL